MSFDDVDQFELQLPHVLHSVRISSLSLVGGVFELQHWAVMRVGAADQQVFDSRLPFHHFANPRKMGFP
jgi:hypothetical protein